MTELEMLRTVPRDPELANGFARRVEPAVGFIAYGILYISFVMSGAVLAAIFAVIGLNQLLHLGTTLLGVLAWTAIAVATLATGWLFVRWARGKRARARALIERGEIVEATLADRLTDRAAQFAARLAFSSQGQPLGVTWYRVEWTHGGKRYHGMCPLQHKPAGDVRCSVLFHPSSAYGLAFDTAGKGVVTRVRCDR